MIDDTKNVIPVKLRPVYKNYMWGGEKLKKQYNKDSKDSLIAESWELSTHNDGKCKIISNLNEDISLMDFIQSQVTNCLGFKAKSSDEIPLLVKLIDAREDLSIQVHPDNTYALKNEHDSGKTEMWVVLENEPDSFVYYGVKKKITKEDMLLAIENDTILDLLYKVSAKRGDIIFIPPGTIHALGKGLVVCEIQQCSNVTYRLFDYNRTDKNGNARELHIKKALEVANLVPQQLYTNAEGTLLRNENVVVQILKSSPYFNVYKYTIYKMIRFGSSKETFIGLIVLSGKGVLRFNSENIEFQKGETCFLPAQEQEYEIRGRCEILAIML